jgi:hypothetical protein
MTSNAGAQRESRLEERQRNFPADPRYAVAPSGRRGCLWVAWRDGDAVRAHAALASGYAVTRERAVAQARVRTGANAMALPAGAALAYRHYWAQQRRAALAGTAPLTKK